MDSISPLKKIQIGKYYSTIGEIMASKIDKGHHDIDHYLSKIPRNVSSLLVLRSTNVIEIESIINGLPNKTSHGHDSIRNTLLKQLHRTIAFPLSLVFNQSIVESIFPTQMEKGRSDSFV